MPVLFGIILGIILTIAAAFAYDTTTGRAPNGLTPAPAGGHPPMVNWNVVSDNWQDVKVHLRNAGAEVERGWKRITS
jgi:hypothetical protein